MTPKLFDHQVEGVEWLRGHPRAALYDEPGLGKSLEMIKEATEPALIVAPAMVLDAGVWDDEIEKWAPGIEATQVSYTSLTERERTAKGGNRPTGRLKPEYRGHYGTVIGDESHHLSRTAHWTELFENISADQTRLGTGTPMNNWAWDAFNQLRIIFPEDAKRGCRLGSFWRWVAEWFHVGPTFFSQWEVGDFRDEAHHATCLECQSKGDARTWEEFQEENWSDRMLLRLRKDCLDLPPLTPQQMLCHMKGPQKKAYNELKNDFVTWIGDGKEVAAWNQAAQTVKLAKCATGLEILDRSAKGSAKLDMLRELIKDRPRPTLVVGFFNETVEAAARACEEVGAEARFLHGNSPRADRRELARSFKSGNLQVLCASIDLIREGMTFTVADQIIKLERHAIPSRNYQVDLRLHRIGQVNPVLAIDLVTKNTWDQKLLRILAKKTDQQMKALGKPDLLALA